MIKKLDQYQSWEIQKHRGGSVQVVIIHNRMLAKECGPAELLPVVINGAIERIEHKLATLKKMHDEPGANPAKSGQPPITL